MCGNPSSLLYCCNCHSNGEEREKQRNEKEKERKKNGQTLWSLRVKLNRFPSLSPCSSLPFNFHVRRCRGGWREGREGIDTATWNTSVPAAEFYLLFFPPFSMQPLGVVGVSLSLVCAPLRRNYPKQRIRQQQRRLDGEIMRGREPATQWTRRSQRLWSVVQNNIAWILYIVLSHWIYSHVFSPHFVFLLLFSLYNNGSLYLPPSLSLPLETRPQPLRLLSFVLYPHHFPGERPHSRLIPLSCSILPLIS